MSQYGNKVESEIKWVYNNDIEENIFVACNYKEEIKYVKRLPGTALL